MSPARNLAVALVAAAAAACADRAEPPELWKAPEGPALARRFAVERWDTLWVAGGSETDSTLLHPYHIQVARGSVYLFDIGPQRLVALDTAGHVRWTLGREGAGPNEFRNVRDMKLGRDGLLYLLDPQNNRVAVVGPTGQVQRRVPLDRVGHAEQMVPLDDGRMVLVTMDPGAPLALVDASGAPAGHVRLPWKPFTRIHPMARQGWTAVAPDGRAWVYAFMLGDGWFPFQGPTPGRVVGRYADHRRFPRVVVDHVGGGESVGFSHYVPCTGCDAVLADSSLYVLAGGSEASLRRVVDRFRVRDGAYLESYRLPGPARRIAVAGGTLYAVVDEPVPAVLALRPHIERPDVRRSS